MRGLRGAQPSLKQLGFYFSERPTVDKQIEMTTKKVRRRYWGIIADLKKAKLEEDDLLAMYKCFILPLIDYACVVYRPILSGEQAKAALKIIYDHKKSYSTIIEVIQGKVERLDDDNNG